MTPEVTVGGVDMAVLDEVSDVLVVTVPGKARGKVYAVAEEDAPN